MVKWEWHALRLSYFYRFISCRDKNKLNYLDNAKFASLVQKIALRLKIITFFSKFHSENSSRVNLVLIARLLDSVNWRSKSSSIVKSLGSLLVHWLKLCSLKFKFWNEVFNCENRLRVFIRQKTLGAADLDFNLNTIF